jgi:hypothetical protein
MDVNTNRQRHTVTEKETDILTDTDKTQVYRSAIDTERELQNNRKPERVKERERKAESKRRFLRNLPPWSASDFFECPPPVTWV